MKLATTRFGEVDVKESEWIEIKGSILGFEQLRRFVLLINDEDTPLCWLQSLEDPALAFVVINPLVIKPDYKPFVFENDLDFLGIKKRDEAILLSIVTIRSNPFRITANLKAPLLINAASRTANQVILEDDDYQIQYELLDHKTDLYSLSDRQEEISGLRKIASNVSAI